MQAKILLILLIFAFISCDDNTHINNEVDTVRVVVNDNKLPENNDTLSNYIILDKIKGINTNILPFPIREYLLDNKSIKLNLFDYYTAGFQTDDNDEYFQAKAQYLKPYTGKEIICFNVFKSNSAGFTNYFYFLQKFNGEWTNISESLVSDEIIKLLKTELNTNIDYQKANNLNAYFSGKTDKALLFDFSSSSKILVFVNDNWISVGQIGFVDNKLQLIAKTNNSGSAKMLSSNELDASKRYTNLEWALSDSSNVYILDLSSIGMTKFKNSICNLKRLQVLILEDNYLTELPEEICSMNKLQILRIGSNQIKSLPTNLGSFINIEEITASNNSISFLPISLGKATSLRVLNLDHNKLSSIIVDFSLMKNLVILNLSYNNISSLPTSIGDLENLISLDISNNPIQSLPNQIYKLKNLTYVDISKTNIPDSQIVRLMDENPDMTIIMD